MDRQVDNPPKKNVGLNRRNFLKLSGASVASVLLPNVPNMEWAKPKTELTVEKALLDPTSLLDNVTDKINRIAPKYRTDIQKGFLMMFSSSENEGFTRDYRDVLIGGYKKYGPEILKVRQKLTNLNLFPGQDINHDQPFFSNLNGPFDRLVQMVNEKAPFDLKREDYDGLLKLCEWFRNALAGTYDQQKNNYIGMGGRYVDLKNLKDNIRAEWDFVIKAQRWGKIEGWQSRRIEGEQVELGIIDVIRKNLPLALAKFNFFSFDHRRGYYREVPGEGKGEFVGQREFFDGIMSWFVQRGIISNSSGINDAQSDFSNYLLVLTHELAHGVDPLFTDTPDRFFMFHPKDYLDYLDGYLDMEADFLGLVDGDRKKGIKPITAQEIEWWFMDPLAVKEGFGTDEITSSDGARTIIKELYLPIRLCVELEDPKEGPKLRKLVEKLGLEELFIKNKNGMLLNWRQKLGESGKCQRYQQVFFDRVTSFDHISTSNINSLEEMVTDIFIEKKGDYEDWEREMMAGVIIRMKSLYMFASYALLRGMEREGILQKDDFVLYPIYQSLSTSVNWQLAHAMTGPLGEYLSMSGDMRRPPEMQEKNFVDSARLIRRTSAREYKGESERIPRFLERFHHHIVKAQKNRSRMWGADTVEPKFKANPNLVYPEIAKEVIEGVLGFTSLF